MNASLLNKYIIFLAPYSIFVSILYLLGYWGEFDINIFEYIGLGDIIKTAIYQLAYYGGFVLLGVAITEIFLSPVLKKVYPPGGGADLPEAKYFRLLWRIYVIAIVGYATYIALFTASDRRWFIAAALISPVAFTAISSLDILSEVIPNAVIRNAVTLPLVIILLSAYGWGITDAHSKKSNGIPVKINGIEDNKTYIGRAGGYVFLWSIKSKTVEIVAENKISILSYSLPNEKPPFMALFQSKETKDAVVPHNKIQPMPKGETD